MFFVNCFNNTLCNPWVIFMRTFCNFGYFQLTCFGEGEGTFGYSNPGVKKWAPRVYMIEPSDAIAFPNVIVQTGINCIGYENVECTRNRSHDGNGPDRTVGDVYSRYKSKIEMIRHLNPSCTIYVVPILPTKSQELNHKANIFNNLLFSDLLQSSCCAVPVHGLDELLDKNRMLSRSLSFDGDAKHINRAGARILAAKIKRTMYLRKLHGGFNRPHNEIVKAGSLSRRSMT